MTLYFTVTDPAPSSGVASFNALVDGAPAWDGPRDNGDGRWVLSLQNGQGLHTITYWATDRSGNTESVETTSVIFDWTPPTTISNALASYTGTATITLTPTDNSGGSGVSATYWKDGSGGTVHASAVATISPPASGTVSHTLYFWSADSAGNTETQKSATFTVKAP